MRDVLVQGVVFAVLLAAAAVVFLAGAAKVLGSVALIGA
jgi:hypothetical protein